MDNSPTPTSPGFRCSHYSQQCGFKKITNGHVQVSTSLAAEGDIYGKGKEVIGGRYGDTGETYGEVGLLLMTWGSVNSLRL